MNLRDFPLQNVMQRFAFLVLLPLLVWFALNLLLPAPVLATLFDGVVFFFCTYNLAAYNQRTTNVFMSSGAMDSLEWLVIALFYLAVAAIMAVVWSVRWRAAGHIPSFGDEELRAGFRYVYALGFASLAISQGDYQARVPPRRWITIASIILAALAVVALGLYSDQIAADVREFFHDKAPALGETSHVS